MDDAEEQLYTKLKILDQKLWGGRIGRPEIDRWLDNFNDEQGADAKERLHALYLLSQFIYFSDREMRELMKAVYRDLYRYPIVEGIRKAHGDTLDPTVIDPLLDEELASTRFLGVGNPAESGSHLLYYFRQENEIVSERFISASELFDRDMRDPEVRLADESIRRVVFIDDFCGSGSQVIDYSTELLSALRDVEQRTGVSLHLSYLVVAATLDGLQTVDDTTAFDCVESVFKLDDSYRAVSDDSRHFQGELPEGVVLEKAKALALKHGNRLWPPYPLGYEDCELLLGFHHNVPDNTLPIIWWDEPTPPWRPIFKRYQKVYDG